MSLREFICRIVDMFIPHPDYLSEINVANKIDEVCFYGLTQYMMSWRFRDDLDNLLLDVQDALDHGYAKENLSILFDKEDGKYQMKLLKNAPDNIDQYQ